MTNTEQEVWKPYPEFDFVEVSNLGRVRTKDRYVPNGKNSKRLVKGHVLKQYPKKNGYMHVMFGAGGKVINLRVNRAVAICFIPNPNNYPEVNHKDNDITNNSVSNLEWCDRQYNIDYRKNFGTSASELFGRPVIAVNLDTFEIFWFESQREAERRLGIFNQGISEVVRGKLNKTHGFWFCCADEKAVEKARAKFGDEIANEVEKLMNEHLN